MTRFPRIWYRVVHCIAAVPQDVTPHILRHSHASLAADSGQSDASIAGQLGHVGPTITRRYIRSADAALLATVDHVAEEIIRLMSLASDE